MNKNCGYQNVGITKNVQILEIQKSIHIWVSILIDFNKLFISQAQTVDEKGLQGRITPWVYEEK